MLFYDEPLDTPGKRHADRQDPLRVVSEIQQPCAACRLGQLTDRQNNGFSFLGPVTARIAFLGDMPDIESCSLSRRAPAAGQDLAQLQRWWQVVNRTSEEHRVIKNSAQPADIAFSDVLVLNTVQCKTEKGKASKDTPPRLPFPEEISVCFPARALRFLQSLPNLQCVITLGWTAAAALLGRHPEPRPKSHEGSWFGTDLLPGVAVFCLDHPREFRESDSKKLDPIKVGRLLQHLNYFHTEFINPATAQILSYLALKEAERKG